MRNALIMAAAACIPSILLLLYVYRLDRINKEPFGLLVKLFLAGCLISVPVYFAEMFILKAIERFAGNELLYDALNAFVVAALTEELFKLIVTRLLVWKHPAFDSTFDGIIYCAFTSMGFATAENLLYGWLYGISVLKTRAFTSIPGHFAFAVIMGIFLSQAKQHELLSGLYPRHKETSVMYRILSLLMPIIFHGSYDFFVMRGSMFYLLLFALVLFVVYFVTFRLIRKEAKRDMLF